MRSIFALIAFCGLLAAFSVQAQTPAYFYHNPGNAGVNNLFFHSINGRMVFIYTAAELNAIGMPANYNIQEIWFRHNTGNNITITDFRVELGHTSLTSPVALFSNNFNVGSSTVALNAPTFLYNAIPGAWNNPAQNWSSITLSSGFTWNGSDNLAVQIQFSNTSSSVLGFYADNGGAPITRYHNDRNASTANQSTARPMLGFSGGGIFNEAAWDLYKKENGNLYWTYSNAEQVTQYTIQAGQESFGNFRAMNPQRSGNEHEISLADLPENTRVIRVLAHHQDGSIHASETLSLKTQASGSEIQVFPNPVSPHQSLQLRSVPENTIVRLYDQQGLMIQHVKSPVREIDLEQLGLKPGLYLLRSYSPGGSQTLKLMVRE